MLDELLKIDFPVIVEVDFIENLVKLGTLASSSLITNEAIQFLLID